MHNIADKAIVKRHPRQRQTHFHPGLGSKSEENRCLGFIPAFYDSLTGRIHLSHFADGSRAPIHVVDGLPSACLEHRGSVHKLKSTVTAGFVRNGRFYSRAQAARIVQRAARWFKN